MVGQERGLIAYPYEKVILPGELGPDIHALIIVARVKRIRCDSPARRLALHEVGGDSELEEERQVPRFHLDVGRYLVVRTLLQRVYPDKCARVPAVELHVRAEIREPGSDRHPAEEIRLEGRPGIDGQ